MKYIIMLLLLAVLLVSSCSLYKEIPKKFDVKKYYDNDPFYRAKEDQLECLRLNLGENILHQIRNRFYEPNDDERFKVKNCIEDFDTSTLKINDIFSGATKDQDTCLKNVLGSSYDLVRFKKMDVSKEKEELINNCIG